jgi:hypothetical protein
VPSQFFAKIVPLQAVASGMQSRSCRWNERPPSARRVKRSGVEIGEKYHDLYHICMVI